jgi:hypothetical protein
MVFSIEIQDIRGDVVVFEAGCPGRKAKGASVHPPVRFVDCAREEDLLVVVSATGKVMLMTHPFGEIESIE